MSNGSQQDILSQKERANIWESKGYKSVTSDDDRSSGIMKELSDFTSENIDDTLSTRAKLWKDRGYKEGPRYNTSAIGDISIAASKIKSDLDDIEEYNKTHLLSDDLKQRRLIEIEQEINLEKASQNKVALEPVDPFYMGLDDAG